MIIGSHAAKFHFSDFREPKDLDIISEIHLMTENEQHYWIPEFAELKKYNKGLIYADPDVLISLKGSHLGFRNQQWEKHASDFLFLKSKGCKIIPELYHLLFKGWLREFGPCWATLKGKDSKTFFEDKVTRKYVHDDIHIAIKTYDEPLYEKILGDGVMCSGDKFDELSEEDKILLVKEEVWVTALERTLIPNDFKCSEKLAYAKALKLMAISLTGNGFLKHWIIFNFDKLNNNQDTSYIDKFKLAEKEGRLTLIKDMETKQTLLDEIAALELRKALLQKELEVGEKADAFIPTAKSLLKLMKETDNDYQSELHDEDGDLDLGFGWNISHYFQYGGEGMGDEYYIILELKKDGIRHSLWEVPGWYASYDGGELEWGNLFQCEEYKYEATGYRSITG